MHTQFSYIVLFLIRPLPKSVIQFKLDQNPQRTRGALQQPTQPSLHACTRNIFYTDSVSSLQLEGVKKRHYWFEHAYTAEQNIVIRTRKHQYLVIYEVQT